MPDEFAYQFTGQPGFMAIVAGEVIHVIQCLPVELRLRQNELCYNQLPVWRGYNETFITPRTHILVNEATQVPCNTPLPQYFRFDKIWYKFLPKPTRTENPSTLNPITTATWEYCSPAELASTGIYTLKDLEQMRNRIMFPVEKAAITNTFAAQISNGQSQNSRYSYASVLSMDDLDNLTQSIWEKTWGKFTSVVV